MEGRTVAQLPQPHWLNKRLPPPGSWGPEKIQNYYLYIVVMYSHSKTCHVQATCYKDDAKADAEEKAQ